MISNHLVIQNKVTDDKIKNLANIKALIAKNFCSNVNFIILPEFFNCPYGIQHVAKYAEELKPNQNNPSFLMLKELSEIYANVYIIGGSIPQLKNSAYFNTSTVWFNGNLVCSYSKIHLFDMDETKVFTKKFKESSVLTSGSTPCYFDTPYGRVGLGICYDLRFNSLSNYYSENNCDIIVYPYTFSKLTGELHAELLLRARAVDSQCWTVGVTSLRDSNKDYDSYAKSFIINPYGSVEATSITNSENAFIYKIDTEYNKYFKNMIPLADSKKII